MDINSSLALDIWTLFRDDVPASKKEDLADRYLELLEEYGLDTSDLLEIEGEDRYLDAAIVARQEEHEEYEEDEDED
jgi:hypothetical protein